MRLLLHICCAPCAIMPVADLRQEGVEVMGLAYNPNVQPYTENTRRQATLEEWAAGQELRLIVQDEYDPEAWLRGVAWREHERCRLCYHQRLSRAAQTAKKGGFDAFGTTLLYSVRQKHDLVAEIGRQAAAERGVAFFYRDWRPLWRQGVAASLDQGLYRQPYCGCIFSERDRFLGRPKGSRAKRDSER